MPARTFRFRALDGFRGVCALLVALFHWPLISHLTGRQFFLPNCQMLMDFFFVMSGFIIAASYGDQLNGWVDFRRFAVRRFARLWPLHVCVLAAFVAIECAKALLAPRIGLLPPFTATHSVGAIVANLLLIHGLHVEPMLTWNAPSWTVSVEFYTYLVFGACTVLAPKWRNAWTIALAAVGFIGVAFIARQLAATYDYGLFRCFYGFFCGVMAQRLWLAVAERDPPWGARAATVLEALSLIGVFGYMIFWGGIPGGFAGPLVFGLFIWLWAFEGGQVTAFMGRPGFVRLGEISYSIYLVHYLIVVMLGLILRAIGVIGHFNYATFGIIGVESIDFISLKPLWLADLITAAYLALVVAISGLTYRFIEQPGRVMFAPLTRRARSAAPALESAPVK